MTHKPAPDHHQKELEMVDMNVTTPDAHKGIFVSCVPPYVVHSDGVLVGEYATEEEAENRFEQLRAERKAVRFTLAAAA